MFAPSGDVHRSCHSCRGTQAATGSCAHEAQASELRWPGALVVGEVSASRAWRGGRDGSCGTFSESKPICWFVLGGE